MIVRDESHIIEKTLTNICQHVPISYWVICDTGSNDDTKAIIIDFFHKKGIKGEMFDDEWIDFGHNRTLALTKAYGKTDYLFIFDADDYIHGDFTMPVLQYDSYFFQFGTSFTYKRPLLINNKKKWTFIGILHEYLACSSTAVEKHVDGDYYVESGRTGGRHKDPQRLLKDAQILEKGFHKENGENNADLAQRYAFYCGQSYKDCGMLSKAIEYYNERIKFGGWMEEVFNSYYQIGTCYLELKEFDKAHRAFIDGYQNYPQRSETLYELCRFYRINGQCELANIYFNMGHNIPYSKHSLFCNADIYTYLFEYEFFVFYYYIKQKNRYSKDIIHTLFYKLLNTQYEQNNVLSNYQFYIRNIEGEKTPINIHCPYNYVSSTPSMIKSKKGYLVNVRMTNVVYNGNYVLQEKNEVTKNITLILNDAFEIIESHDFDDNEKYANFDNPRGLFFGEQDIRLYNFNDKTIYTGITSYIGNDEKKIGVVLGEYGSGSRIIPSPNNRQCEKNWALFHTDNDLYCLYEWYPLSIYKIDENVLSTYKKTETPEFFKLIRGSTNGYIVNDEIWFVCHIVSHQKERHYMHLIVILDSVTFDIKRFTFPFKFEKTPIEYCLGLIVNDNDVIFTYSTNDSSSNILRVTKKQLENYYVVNK